MTSEEFVKMTNAIIVRIRDEEETTREAGMKQSELVDWWMDLKEDAIETEAELLMERTKIKSALARLIQKVLHSDIKSQEV